MLAIDTVENTVISPNFLVCQFGRKAQFPQQEIRWNYGICAVRVERGLTL